MSPEKKRRFVAVIMPVVKRYARWRFSAANPEEKEERTAEAVAACFISYIAIVKAGRDMDVTPKSLAFYAVKHVLNGRHVGGHQDSATDALSRNAQKAKGFTVTRLGTAYTLPPVIREALTENSRSAVADQVAFRVDFPQFLGSEPPLKQQVAQLLSVGHRTSDVSRLVGVSSGRISQIRRELAVRWDTLNA